MVNGSIDYIEMDWISLKLFLKYLHVKKNILINKKWLKKKNLTELWDLEKFIKKSEYIPLEQLEIDWE